MQTIREPKGLKIEVYTLECSHCEALLECEQHELKIASDQRDGTSWGTLTCPHCQRETIFTSEELKKHRNVAWRPIGAAGH